jgi:hypothetical protein
VATGSRQFFLTGRSAMFQCTLASSAVVAGLLHSTIGGDSRLQLEQEAVNRIVARIDNEVIYANDVSSYVDAMLSRLGAPRNNDPTLRKKLWQTRLASLIQTKLVMLEARQDLPEKQLMLAALRLTRTFYEEEVPRLVAKEGVQSAEQLDLLLRQRHTSIGREKELYIERHLAMGWLIQQFRSKEIGPEQRKEKIREYLSQLEKRRSVQLLDPE